MPAGMLATIPVNADTPAMIPTPVGLAPRNAVNSGKTGLFEIVELNIAKIPEVQRRIKGVTFNSIVRYIIISPDWIMIPCRGIVI